MRAEGERVVQGCPLPRSAKAIASHTQRLLASVQSLRDQGAARVRLMHHLPAAGASYAPHDRHVFPVSLSWLRELQQTAWPGTCIPTFRIEPEQMLAELIEQYLFVSLFRAYAGSMAAENASRLASMQAAERNIEDRLDNLRNTYHRLRQSQITSELLDVMAGFEAARE
jgi:F-type H+-transporting ATPase subunit gamma